MSTFVEAESALNHRLCECGLVPGEPEAIGIIASPCLNYEMPEKMHQAVGANGTQRLFKQNEKPHSSQMKMTILLMPKPR